MSLLTSIVAVLFILDCLALVVIVLLQKGKAAGLTGTISGAGETYWGKNKARSLEGKLERITRVFAFLFIGLALVLFVLMSK